MKQKDFIKELKNPETFDGNVDSVKLLQTHISYVALTGEYAYKVKKPVDFGFLDFSTLEKRKYFCEQELKLNKRLCPQIYEKVVPITQKDNVIEVDGDGIIVDYAVKMKEFPQKNIMSSLLDKDKISFKKIDYIVDNLVDFYKSEKSTDEIKKFGEIKTIKQNTDENFQQTESMIGEIISNEDYSFIRDVTNQYLKDYKLFFERRIKKGYIKDCHGDLHSGNIVLLDDDICIFDCIEFNKRFRYSDIASDIGFLAMDLDFKGHAFLSSYLIERYVKRSDDKSIFDVLNFYKCYRAYVRGKVTGFRLSDDNIDSNEREEIKKTASNYFDLACYYARLMKYKLEQKNRRVLFITSGLTGTGKTTAAKKVKIDYNAKVVSTDVVRKKLAGIDKYERHHDAYNTGMYSPQKMRETYHEVFKIGKKLLNQGKNVVFDATFKSADLRKEAYQIALQANSKFVILNTICPEEVVKKYLDRRVESKSVSDGRWEIYVKQKNSFEDFNNELPRIKIDISKKSLKYQLEIFNKVLNLIVK